MRRLVSRNVRFSPKLWQAVEETASRLVISKSLLIERAVEAYLPELEGDESDRLDAEILAERRMSG